MNLALRLTANVEVKTLELSDFRNYQRAQVEFQSGLTLVMGDNGQGKTNLLEAIHLLSAFGSHRVSSLAPLLRHETERAVVRASGVAGGRKVEVDVEVRKTGGLRVRINRVAVQASQPGPGGLACVLFSPEDLDLVKGEPDGRRRLLDQGASQIRPRASVERSEFERVLRQRNGALKAAQINPRAKDSLGVWDEQFARSGALVVRNRLQVMEGLTARAGDYYQDLAMGSRASLELVYRPSWRQDTGELDHEGIEEGLSRALELSKERDVERGFCNVGPHRDDLDLMLGGAQARTFASQGEQRTVALAIRLAMRDLISEIRGEEPILLLDDVFSELDDHRRRKLGELIDSSAQTIATATALHDLPVKPERIVEIAHGAILQ